MLTYSFNHIKWYKNRIKQIIILKVILIVNSGPGFSGHNALGEL